MPEVQLPLDELVLQIGKIRQALVSLTEDFDKKLMSRLPGLALELKKRLSLADSVEDSGEDSDLEKRIKGNILTVLSKCEEIGYLKGDGSIQMRVFLQKLKELDGAFEILSVSTQRADNNHSAMEESISLKLLDIVSKAQQYYKAEIKVGIPKLEQGIDARVKLEAALDKLEAQKTQVETAYSLILKVFEHPFFQKEQNSTNTQDTPGTPSPSPKM